MAIQFPVSLRIRFRRSTVDALTEMAQVRGVSVPRVARELIEDALGEKHRVSQVSIPDVPVKPLVRQVSPPAGKNDQERRPVMDDDVEGSMTPPPTRWAGRTVQMKRQVRVSAPRCTCPPSTPVEGGTCSQCWRVR